MLFFPENFPYVLNEWSHIDSGEAALAQTIQTALFFLGQQGTPMNA